MISSILMNEEQASKFDLEQVKLDYKGVVNRNRKVNQTIFDIMLVHELVNPAEHEACFHFVKALAESGANVASANLELLSHAPAYTIGGSISDRRMSFSSAYRFIVDHCGDSSADSFIKVANNLFVFPAKKSDQSVFAKKLIRLVRDPIKCLVKFYSVDERRDPRDVLRRQVGAFRKTDRKVNDRIR